MVRNDADVLCCFSSCMHLHLVAVIFVVVAAAAAAVAAAAVARHCSPQAPSVPFCKKPLNHRPKKASTM